MIGEDVHRHVNDRLLPAMMIWGHDINVENIHPPRSLMWTGRGKNPVALMRTSWTDSSAIYVAMKGGSGNVNHAHMDVGSFVMDAGGVRWAMDFGAQDYESLESKGMQIFGRSQDAQRWTIFRYVNQAHNTLTINDQHQLVKGFAPITGHSADKNFMSATVDLGEVYKGSLVAARRGIAIVDQKYVVVRDEVEAPDSATVLRWTLLTPATVKITGKNTAELTQGGRRLLMKVEADVRSGVASPGAVQMKTWVTDPPPNSYDAPNPGTIRTGFELNIPAKGRAAIIVTLVPEGVVAGVSRVPPLDEWKKD